MHFQDIFKDNGSDHRSKERGGIAGFLKRKHRNSKYAKNSVDFTQEFGNSTGNYKLQNKTEREPMYDYKYLKMQSKD